MAVMYSCCRYFSVRLGTILVAILTMVQSLLMCGYLLLWLRESSQTAEHIREWSSANKLSYATGLVNTIQQSVSVSLKSGIVFLMLHIGTCVLLIYAALKCSEPLTWPFLTLEFLRLVVLLFAFVTTLMLVKENMFDLGLLLAVSLSGVFLLLWLSYSWFCVVSLCQCLQEVRQRSEDTEKQSPTTMARPTYASGHGDLLLSDYRHVYSQRQGELTGWRQHMYSNMTLHQPYTINNMRPNPLSRLTN